jgi:hypothetical protein
MMFTLRHVAAAAVLSFLAVAVTSTLAESRSGPGGGGGFRGGGGGGFGGGGGGFRGGGMSGGFRGGAMPGGFRGGAMPGGFRGGAMPGGFRGGGVPRGMGRAYGPTIRSGSVRGLPGYRMPRGYGTPRGYAHRSGSIASRNVRPGNYRAMTRGSRQFAHRSNFSNRPVRGSNRTAALRNSAYASHAVHNGRSPGLSNSRFHGRYAGHWNYNRGNWKNYNHGWHWRYYRPIVVIGWWGPLFWPYAYWDFLDYTYWPYAYDEFWPYAYDDVYVGMFGPYAYEGPGYGTPLPAGPGVSRSASAQRARAAAATRPVVCRAPAPALINWPIVQITKVVQPDEALQPKLTELKEATTKAVETLQSACPDDLPSTPTGRLEAMSKRVTTMSMALDIVQPPLQRFYDALTDEQKARFNAVQPDAKQTAGRGTRGLDLSQACDMRAAKATDVPSERIVQAIKPTAEQRSALDALNDASVKASEFLKANCSEDHALTPPGRIAAMQQRLNAMLEAIKIVQPALDKFYGSLTDEQKARFNQLRPQQS